jgi:hypothetical protein
LRLGSGSILSDNFFLAKRYHYTAITSPIFGFTGNFLSSSPPRYAPDSNGGWTQIQSTKLTDANSVVNFTSLEANETHLVCEEKRVGWGNTDPNDGFDIIKGQICQEVPDLQYAAEVREVVFGNIECNITVEAGEDKNVCRTNTAQLEGASFSGSATQTTWSVLEEPEGGDAQFVGDNPSATPGDVVFKATVPGT